MTREAKTKALLGATSADSPTSLSNSMRSP
jgi:hypothetical protein